jgi:hypothetical protein
MRRIGPKVRESEKEGGVCGRGGRNRTGLVINLARSGKERVLAIGCFLCGLAIGSWLERPNAGGVCGWGGGGAGCLLPATQSGLGLPRQLQQELLAAARCSSSRVCPPSHPVQSRPGSIIAIGRDRSSTPFDGSSLRRARPPNHTNKASPSPATRHAETFCQQQNPQQELLFSKTSLPPSAGPTGGRPATRGRSGGRVCPVAKPNNFGAAKAIAALSSVSASSALSYGTAATRAEADLTPISHDTFFVISYLGLGRWVPFVQIISPPLALLNVRSYCPYAAPAIRTLCSRGP